MKKLLVYADFDWLKDIELIGELRYNEYDQFKECIQYELLPVEIHFLESFEETQKKLKK